MTVRVVKASDSDYVAMMDMPSEVQEFFEKLAMKYHHDTFIVEVDPDTYEEGTEASLEVMVYDDYVE